MAADVSQLEEFLVAEMEDTSSTAFVDNLLAAAKTQILAGNGQLAFVQSGSVNGKSFTMSENFSALQMALACRRAKRIYTGDAGRSPFTFLDFGGTSPVTDQPPYSY